MTPCFAPNDFFSFLPLLKITPKWVFLYQYAEAPELQVLFQVSA